MIRVAIVEDEEAYARDLTVFLRQYELKRGVELTVDTFSSGVDFISDYNARYDVVFMDIKLPHMNGMQCAVRLRRLDEDVALIFVTSMNQYALKGYEVGAMGYMIKPISYFPLSVLMDKVQKKLARETTRDIVLSRGDSVRRVSLRDLRFVEVLDHYLIYHTEEGTFREIGRMKTAEEELGGHGFFRCSNSHLINLRYVQAIDENEVTVGTERAPISRRRKKELLEAINNYFKNGGGQ